MSREELLKLSRELTESFIDNKNGALQIEHYFMLSMAKFIMSKERMIKTDSKNRTLYFEDTEENILIIDSFYEQIKDSFTFTMNNSLVPKEIFESVILEHDSNPELKKKIFIIGKIRDSLAHGKYDFATANNRIIIKNRYKIGQNEFNFECSIQPETLDILSAHNQHTIDRTLKAFEGNQDDERYLLNIYKELEKLSEEFSEIRYYCNEEEIMLFNNAYKAALTKLNELATKTKTLSEKRTRVKTKTLSSKDSPNKEDDLLNKIVDSLLAISTLIDRKLERNVVNTALVYNHLCLLLSEKQDLNFRYLKNPSLQIFFKKKNENGKENDITGTLGILKKEIKIFNRKYQKISNYPQSANKLEAMKKIYLDLYTGIMNAFEIRNKNIYTKIRNGIMHSNIEMSKGKVIIKDSYDHNMDDPSFYCKATNKELLEYARCIEEDDNQKSYTLETFISELYITLSSYDIDLNQFRNFFQNLTDCLKYIESNIRLDINSEELKNRISNSDGNVGTNSPLGEEDLESTAPGM